MSKIVLDISGHNGAIDFGKLKAAGVAGVFIKCTEGSGYLAPKFKPLYEGAIAAGLKVGAYHFLRATGVEEARREGLWFGEKIAGLELELGVALDIEDPSWLREGISAEMAGDMVLAFAQGAAAFGRPELYEKRQLLLYASKSYFHQFLWEEEVGGFPLWLANPDKLDFGRPVKLVQYSWTGAVEGVEKAVDLNLLLEEPRVLSPAELKALPEKLEKQPEPQSLYRLAGFIGEMKVELELWKGM